MSKDESFPTYLIPLAKLEKSPLNARKTYANAALQELKASIEAHGLLANLVVTEAKDGNYHVIAGARRLEALKSLAKDGKLPDDYAARCEVFAITNALEISIAENTVREAMHPADEFEAFAKLSDEGRLSTAQIAARFGVNEKHVLQRLKLGRVAPELLKLYRAAELSLETLMAFTVTDDRKKQMAVYKSLQGWQKDNARHIRGCLTDTMTSSRDKLAKFVGLKDYAAAGGTTKSDLFGDDVYLEDTALAHRLAGEKLEAAAEALRADGWRWVEVSEGRDYDFVNRCGRVEPHPVDAPKELTEKKAKLDAELETAEQAYYEYDGDDESVSEPLEKRMNEINEQVEAIDAELESFVAFDADQIKMAGCYVSISHNGEISVEKGLVKPEDKKAVAKTQANASGDDDEQPEPKAKLSDSLRRDLEAYRLGAAQAEIAKHPAIAFDLLVFKAAKDILTVSHVFDGPDIGFRRNYGGPASVEARAPLEEQMDAIEKTLPLDWQELDTEAEQFAAFQHLTAEQKHALLAFCVATTLKPGLAPTSTDRVTAYDIALSQTGANVADYWRPTKDNYLSRITKDQLLAIGRDDLYPHNEHWLRKFKDAKKAALVVELDAAFALSDKPNTIDAIKQWLPEGMAFPAIEAPAEPIQTKKKGKKAA